MSINLFGPKKVMGNYNGAGKSGAMKSFKKADVLKKHEELRLMLIKSFGFNTLNYECDVCRPLFEKNGFYVTTNKSLVFADSGEMEIWMISFNNGSIKLDLLIEKDYYLRPGALEPHDTFSLIYLVVNPSKNNAAKALEKLTCALESR